MSVTHECTSRWNAGYTPTAYDHVCQQTIIEMDGYEGVILTYHTISCVYIVYIDSNWSGWSSFGLNIIPSFRPHQIQSNVQSSTVLLMVLAYCEWYCCCIMGTYVNSMYNDFIMISSSGVYSICRLLEMVLSRASGVEGIGRARVQSGNLH